MTSVSEIPDHGGSQMAGVLRAGLKQLSGDQHVTFNLYRRFVSPLDGLAYWLKALSQARGATTRLTGGLASEIAVAGEAIQVAPGGIAAAQIVGGTVANPFDAIEPIDVSFVGPPYAPDQITLDPGESAPILANPENGVWVRAATAGHQFTVILQAAAGTASDSPLQLTQPGSLHYSTEVEQNEDAVIETNQVIFTSPSEVQPFNQLGPDELYIGERDDIRFAFSSRGPYYEQANLFHYVGQALFSVNRPLIIDDPVGWSPPLVVTNSLPIWLAMPGYVPPYPGFRCPVMLYPSFLVTDNLPPPFGAVHVERSEALAASPTFGPRWQQSQLTKDVVRVTLYGVDNLGAESFVAFVEQYSYDRNKIGMVNMPIVADDKRPQPEFKILAQKKTITFEVAYLQGVARDIARQLISAATIQWIPELFALPSMR